MRPRCSYVRRELKGESGRRRANVPEVDRFIYPRKIILSDAQSGAICRRKIRSVSCQSQLCASALDTAAFFADLGSGGEMNMQRQEKNKQQGRDTDDAAEFVRFRSQRMKHVKNLAQRICRCQRRSVIAEGVPGITGRVPDAAANTASPLVPASQSLAILGSAGPSMTVIPGVTG